MVEAVHLVQKLTQQHIFADDYYAHIYICIHIPVFFFNNYYRFTSRRGILRIVVRLESGHLFDVKAASLVKIGHIPQNKLSHRCFQLRQEMTTATTRKDDIGLVPFKDVCTLLHRIETYHRKEGGKAKKQYRPGVSGQVLRKSLPEVFQRRRKERRVSVVQTLSAAGSKCARRALVVLVFVFGVLLLFSLSILANTAKVGPDERDESHSTLITKKCSVFAHSWTKNARRTI